MSYNIKQIVTVSLLYPYILEDGNYSVQYLCFYEFVIVNFTYHLGTVIHSSQVL